MSLTHSPAKVILEHLINSGILTDNSLGGSWPGFVNHLPDDTDASGVCYDVAGRKDGRYMGGANQFFYGVQVALRSTSYSALWTKAQAVETALAALKKTTVSVTSSVSYTVWNASQQGPILQAGVEPGTKRRQLMTLNFLVRLQED